MSDESLSMIWKTFTMFRDTCMMFLETLIIYYCPWSTNNVLGAVNNMY
jgi:hypothetical protein